MSPVAYLMFATGTACILATLDMPYEFYVTLRGLVSVSAFYLGAQAIIRNQFIWLVVAAPAFVLWFPMFGVTMAREAWLPLNILAAAGFFLAWKKFDFTRD